MDHVSFEFRNGQIEILGIEDAFKAVSITDPQVKKISEMSLHLEDFRFARDCLDKINEINDELISQSLWRSAIMHFAKCFGKGIRSALDPNQVYKGMPSEAMESFLYFKALRNKHLIHDENSYTQTAPAAIINDGSKNYKVEKLVVINLTANTLDEAHWRSLKMLVDHAITWGTEQFDDRCDALIKTLELKSYEELNSAGDISRTVPTASEIFIPRQR